MPNENETRKVAGRVKYIGEIKQLGAQGKLNSLGIRLDTDPENVFHNITSFQLKDIAMVLGDTKVGDNVDITETFRRGYWNVTEIVNVAGTPMFQPERTEETIQTKIELKDMDTMKKCIEDAKKTLSGCFIDEIDNRESYISPEYEAKFTIDVALALFRERTK